MKHLDLRRVGTVCGHALYVDVADIPDFKHKDDLLSQRDVAEFIVKDILEKAFGMRKNKNGKDTKHTH